MQAVKAELNGLYLGANGGGQNAAHPAANFVNPCRKYSRRKQDLNSIRSLPTEISHEKTLPGTRRVNVRCMVRSRGLEPPRYCYHQNLNLARLPIPPRPRLDQLTDDVHLSMFGRRQSSRAGEVLIFSQNRTAGRRANPSIPRSTNIAGCRTRPPRPAAAATSDRSVSRGRPGCSGIRARR